MKLQPRDSQTRALADYFVRQAEARSSSAERLARDAGADETARFGSANARANEAARLAQSGQPTAAVRAYLETMKLYAEAATTLETRPLRPRHAPPEPIVRRPLPP